MKKIRLPKQVLAAALAGALALTPVSAAFSDTAGHWAEGAIDKWSQTYGIIGGYEDGSFRPDASITRGAFAGILDRFFKFQSISPAETFSDTAGAFWEEAVLKLHAAGVYLGNNGKALPSDTITRQQAVTMLARAFQLEATTVSLPYHDAERLSEYARGPVAEMALRGWISDCPEGYFRPMDAITRAEFLNILNNMVQELAQETRVYHADVFGSMLINASGGASLENMTIYGDLILAPGVTGAVTLSNVTVNGIIRNFSPVEPTIVTAPADPSQGNPPLGEEPGVIVVPGDPENPENPVPPGTPLDPITGEPITYPGIQPSEVYTPGTTTGQYIAYSNRQIPVYEAAEPSYLGEGDFLWNTERPDRLDYVGDRFRTRFGIDVSAYQNRASENKTINWDAVAADGVEFAMVRIGLRGYSTGALAEDAYYRENIIGAMNAGIETGVYFFAQAITVEEAIEEADFVIQHLQGLSINGPVAYDWEMSDSSYRVYGTTPEMATACAIAFCRRIEEAGYTPMIYAGNYVGYVKYDQGAITPYLSWYPEYKKETSEKLYPTFYYQMDYWQYTDNCAIDGIGGRVDGNLQFIPLF